MNGNIEVIKTIFSLKNTVDFNEYENLQDSILSKNENIDIIKLNNLITKELNQNIYLFTASDDIKYFMFFDDNKFYIGGPYVNKPREDNFSVVSDLTMIRIINFMGETLFENNYKVNFISSDYRLLSKVSSFDFDGIIDGFEDAVIEEFYNCEKELINSIKNGNRRKSIAIINNLVLINNNSVHDEQSQKTFLNYLNSMFKFALLDTELDSSSINKMHLHYHRLINMNDYNFSDLVLDMVRSYCVLVHDFSFDKYSDVVRNCLEYIEDNINSNFTIKEMSNSIGINPSYISTRFKKELNTSIVDYINYRRVHNSLCLFSDYTMQIADIARNVGISDSNYYSRLFKKIMGMTPTQYRKKIQDNVNRDCFIIK